MFGPVLIRAVAAYSVNPATQEELPPHPREAGGLGFLVEMDGVRIYHAGDTGLIPEMNDLGTVDVASATGCRRYGDDRCRSRRGGAKDRPSNRHSDSLRILVGDG